jgi:CubicO group peptidase (beta-lactamase class C family)
MKSNRDVAAKMLLSCCLLLVVPHALKADTTAGQSISTAVKPSQAGRIVFSATANPKAADPPEQILQTFGLYTTPNLYFTAVFDKPLTAHLQQLAPQWSATTLNQQGNYQFTFLVDGAVVYTENLNPGAGLDSEKTSSTVLSKPLLSAANPDSWGRFLWMRFMHYAGDKALTEGAHQLKIQIRPYLNTPALKVGDLLAEGQIGVTVVKPHVTAQQMAIQPIPPTTDWGLSKDSYNQNLIRAMNKKIAQRDFKDISSVVVIKNGELLLEQYFNGSDRSTLHDPRSVGKSFASTMLGIAIAEGFIQNEQQQLSAFYPLQHYQHYTPAKAKVTLRQLLTMTSGFTGDDADSASAGNEENMYPTADWVRFTLDLPMQNSAAQAAATPWQYFTAGVVVLGDILQKTVPGGLESYADKKLFAPLGIKKYQWQYTPQQVASTAGGLQLTALDFAKYGQLYKNGGRWGQQQILPAAWVKASLAKQVTRTGQKDGGHYGYLFWNDQLQVGQQQFEVAYASGNGGNKIFIFKDIPVVIVVTAKAYNRVYAHPQVQQMVSEYLLPALLNP